MQLINKNTGAFNPAPAREAESEDFTGAVLVITLGSALFTALAGAVIAWLYFGSPIDPQIIEWRNFR